MSSGRQGSIGIGPETVFGTPVPPIAFYNGTESITEERGRLREPITFGSRSLQPADAGRLRINGGIDGIHARPSAIGHLLRAALGEPETSGAGPYVHTFTPANAKFSEAAALPPYSISVKRSASVIHRYSGGQLNSLTLSQPRDNALTLATAWIAKGVGDVSDTAMIQETAGRFRFAQFTVERDGQPFDLLEDFSLTIANNLETEELLDGSHEIAGTDFGDSQISLSLTATFRDSLGYADFKNNTTKPWSFKWTQGADSLELIVPRLNIESWSAPIRSPGRLTVTSGGQAEHDAVEGFGFQAILTNTTESY